MRRLTEMLSCCCESCEFSQCFWHLGLPKDANAITLLWEMLPERNLQNIFVLKIWMGCHHDSSLEGCYFFRIAVGFGDRLPNPILNPLTTGKTQSWQLTIVWLRPVLFWYNLSGNFMQVLSILVGSSWDFLLDSSQRPLPAGPCVGKANKPCPESVTFLFAFSCFGWQLLWKAPCGKIASKMRFNPCMRSDCQQKHPEQECIRAWIWTYPLLRSPCEQEVYGPYDCLGLPTEMSEVQEELGKMYEILAGVDP